MKSIRRLTSATLLVTAALTLLGCGRDEGADSGSQSVANPDVLAMVDGYPITAGALQYHRDQSGHRDDSRGEAAVALDALVRRAALVQRARRAGLDDDPEVVAQWENLLIRKLRERELEPLLASVTVSDEEIGARYEAERQSRFLSPARDRVAVLWFGTRGQQPLVERFRPRLVRARAQVVERPEAFPPASGFGVLAIECSEHRASRYRGGDLGWVACPPGSDNSFEAAAARAGAALAKPGDLSPVLEDGHGLYVVRLVERVGARTKPLAAVREQLAEEILSEKRRAHEESFLTDPAAAAQITRFPARLETPVPQSALRSDRDDRPREVGHSSRLSLNGAH